MKKTLTSGQIVAQLNLAENSLVHEVSGQSEPWESAFATPHRLPPVHECIVPGDRIVVVADPETPQLVDLMSTVWEQLHVGDVEQLDVTVLLPEDPSGREWKPLIEALPAHLTEQASIHIHDLADEQQRRYLASSAGGERVYLSEHLIDADLIVTVGTMAFNSRLGYCGTTSAIFPAFSDAEAVRSSRIPGHVELTPDDKRPARELVDEIGWLLGTQFAVQAIPNSAGGIAALHCGGADDVMKAGIDFLRQHQSLEVDEPVDLAVVDVPVSSWSAGWPDFSNALTAATNIVEDGGSVAVVADLPLPEGPAMQSLQRCREPEELLKPISMEPPPDALETLLLIRALRKVRVYLLSSLPADQVDALGMIPLESEAELQRVIDAASRTAFLPSAHLVWSRLTSAVG